MTTEPFDTPPPALTPQQERLERYLDGVMNADERAAFEGELTADAGLRAQVETHRRVCRALHALAEPPREALPTGPLRFAEPAPPARSHRWVKVGAVAASIGLPLAAAIWYFAPRPRPARYEPPSSETYQARHRALILDEYRKQLAAGFRPSEVCTTDAEFVEWTTRSLGRGLKPLHKGTSEGTAEPQLAGWSRSTTFSAYTGLLLASVDGKPVMVVMDQAPPDRMVPEEDAVGSPRLFRRKVGGVWLIEVTPLDRPRVITMIEPATP